MRIISWNVNGLRSLHRGGYWKWFEEERPDIFCIQEMKATPDDLSPEVQNPLGYHTYFNPARTKKGYSGVALYTKEEPAEVLYDVLPDRLNAEGRLIEAHFRGFTLLNVYFPNGGGGPEKLQYKLDFYDAFLSHIMKLSAAGDSVVFCGDLNVAHEEIDAAHPEGKDDHILFLPEERVWVDEVVAAGFVDVFRHFYPHKTGCYTWWDMRTHARNSNNGWRIDYFFVSQDLIHHVNKFITHTDVYGSDHCPTELVLDL